MPTLAIELPPELDALSIYTFEPDIKKENVGITLDDWDDVESSSTSLTRSTKPTRQTTDLVRLYLQEIGRVPLLKPAEEISEAQNVQRYMRLLDLRAENTTPGDEVLQRFVQLSTIYERLAFHLGHLPQEQQWAAASGVDIFTLKHCLAAGKQRWAQLADLSIEALDQIQKKGLRSKERLLKANLRLVVSVAKKYQNRGLELLDLIQEGTLGLEQGVEKFDPTKGYRFSTYAYWWIRQGITRAIATQSRTIRVPVHITEKLNKVKKATSKVSQAKGRTATLEEIAQELDMTNEQVRQLLQRMPRSVSLDIKVGRERDTELGELLETKETSPEDQLMQESLSRDLRRLLSELTEREQEVLKMRFGLSGSQTYSLAEIGRIMELSRERVRQIELKALKKLQQPNRRYLVQDYLEVLN